MLGATFTFSGLVKANDPMGTIYKIEDYFAAWSLHINQDSAMIFAIILMMAEFILGIMLIFNIANRLTAKATLILMSAMTVLTLWLALTNAVDDCGCFGDVIVLTNWQTFIKNIVLLAMAVIIVSNTKQKCISLTKAKWFMIGGTVAYLLFAAYNYFCLPAIDFSPYKVGSNIKEKMELPENRNMPEIIDFYIETLNGEDMTEAILAEDTVCLLAMPFIQEASQVRCSSINEFYQACEDNGIKFCCLTASSDDEIKKWKEHTHAQYPFARMDDVTLKTMVRSNPGLIILNYGTVINKYSNWQITNIFKKSQTNRQ